MQYNLNKIFSENLLLPKLGLGVIACFFVVGAFSIGKYPDEQKKQGMLAGHSRQIINQLSILDLHITQAETGQRGYLLTQGNETYLEPYRVAKDKIGSDIKNLEALTLNEREQTEKIPALKANINAKLGELAKTIDLYHITGNDKKSLEIVFSNAGNNLMIQIDQQITNMRMQEEKSLQLRLAVWQKTVTRARTAFLAVEGILYILICFVFLGFYRVSEQRKKLMEAEKKSNFLQKAEAEKLFQIVAIQREISGHAMHLQDAMNIITHHMQKLTRAEGSIVEIVEGDEIIYKAASGSATPYVGLRLKRDASLSGLSIAQNKLLRCDDAQNDDRVDKAACRRIGLNSMVVVPLRHNDKAVGVLKVLSTIKNAFNDDDIATLELLAGLLSGTLDDALAADALLSANEKLKISNIGLQREALTDGLTGLKNYRSFKELLSQEYERARRYKKNLSLVLMDVDYFKKFNDSFGHPAGDAVLKRVAEILHGLARTTDFAVRYGGEEFAVILPETSSDNAKIIANRIRVAIETAAWDKRPITVSIGISSFDETIAQADALLENADKALYASKEKGRNCVTTLYEISL